MKVETISEAQRTGWNLATSNLSDTTAQVPLAHLKTVLLLKGKPTKNRIGCFGNSLWECCKEGKAKCSRKLCLKCWFNWCHCQIPGQCMERSQIGVAI